MAEVCCIWVRLSPPNRDWGNGTGAAPWGLGWASQPGSVPPPQPGKKGRRGGCGQPIAPTAQLACGRAEAWPGSPFLV